MPTDYSLPDGHIDDYYRAGLHRPIDRELGSERHAIKQLRKALDILPVEFHRPDFEWGIAQILYHQKDQAHAEAEKHLATLKGYLGFVEREIARCKENLDVLARDLGDLKTGAAQGQYRGIILRHTQQYNAARERRAVITELIKTLEALLRESAQKQLPADKRLPPGPYKDPRDTVPRPREPASAGPPAPGGVAPQGPVHQPVPKGV